MLKYAYQYKDALQEIYVQSLDNPKFKYLWYIEGWTEFKLDIKEDTWSKLQYVSVDNGNIIGYLSASIDLKTNSVSSLSIINFYDKSIVFSKDLYGFLDTLVHRYTKISFCVAIGNPAESMYDRMIKKYNGRIVGTKEDHLYIEGELCDLKMYEILRKNLRECGKL